MVAFWVGPRDLVEAHNPIAHLLRFAQLIDHCLFLLSGHSHLLRSATGGGALFYACRDDIVAPVLCVMPRAAPTLTSGLACLDRPRALFTNVVEGVFSEVRL